MATMNSAAIGSVQFQSNPGINATEHVATQFATWQIFVGGVIQPDTTEYDVDSRMRKEYEVQSRMGAQSA